jgi:DNA-binding NarL/FixJ family response regulator
MPRAIKVLVADAHPVVRKGFQSCLARHQKVKFVGEAADGAEALQKTRALAPDVVLMDLASGLISLEASPAL